MIEELILRRESASPPFGPWLTLSVMRPTIGTTKKGARGALGPPNKEQNWENKEQNWGKKFQNGAFLGYGN